MAKRDTPALYSVTAWLLQNLSYYPCRWYFFHLRKCGSTSTPASKRARKPVLIAAAPHLSHADVILVPATMPRRLLPIRWLGDRKIFQGRFKALWLKLWGAIPVDRDALGSVQPADIQRVVEFAERDKCIGVFPECCLVGGPFGDPHRDLVVAALDRRISVLPVGLMGNAKAERSFLPKTIDAGTKVIIGDPLREASELLDSLAS